MSKAAFIEFINEFTVIEVYKHCYRVLTINDCPAPEPGEAGNVRNDALATFTAENFEDSFDQGPFLPKSLSASGRRAGMDPYTP